MRPRRLAVPTGDEFAGRVNRYVLTACLLLVVFGRSGCDAQSRPAIGPDEIVTGTLGAAAEELPSAAVRRDGPAAQSLQSFGALPPAADRRHARKEVVVTLPSNLSRSRVAALARRHRLAPIEAYPIGRTGMTLHRWRIVDRRSVADVVRALNADGGIAAAQPNYRYRTQ